MDLTPSKNISTNEFKHKNLMPFDEKIDVFSLFLFMYLGWLLQAFYTYFVKTENPSKDFLWFFLWSIFIPFHKKCE